MAAIPLILVPLSYLAFAYLGLWVDFVTPLLAIRWGALAAEYLESRHVRKSLGQYVGMEVAKQIVEQDEQLVGKKQIVTVFFTDVRNFTTMCEGLPPEQVVVRMNELFAMMGKVIERHGGTIFDFIGDAVLAVFGAPRENPEHARAAAQSAIEILAGLDELNGRWAKNNLAPLRIGIGLHTGEVIAGIVGTGERKKFDVTGDTVNTGSRVEGLNKELGTAILATRETVALFDGHFTVRNCGEVAVKGREQAVEVFEVLNSTAKLS
jgi:adenylate cyclase